MHLRIRSFFMLLAAVVALLCHGSARGEEQKKAAAAPATLPERREVWVPVKDLATILKNHPDAVVLDAQQYEALIRDAGRVKSGDEKAPVGAVLEGVKFHVELIENSPVVRSTATLVVRGLNDGWNEVLLPSWGGQWGASLVLESIEGGRLDVSRWKREDRKAYMFVQGKGRHEVKLGFVSPVARQGPRCSAVFPVIADPLQLTASLRGRIVTPRDWLVHDGVAQVPLTWSWRKAPGLTLQWFEGERPVAAEAGITQTTSSFTRLEGAEATTDVHILLLSSQGLLPERVRFRIPDADAHVVSIDETYARSWKQEGALIEVELNAGFNASTLVKLTLTRSAPPMAGGSSPLVLDLPRLEGAGRITGHVALSVGEGYEVTAWPAAAAQPVPGQNVLLLEGPRKDLPATQASYAVLPANFTVTVRHLSDRYSADVDLLALVSQHDLGLTRTITFRGEEGNVQRATFTVPQGEQFLSLAFAKGEAIEWKQIEGAVPAIEITWPKGLQKGKTSTLLLGTRKELPVGADAAAPNATPATLALQNLLVPDATRLAGYVALDFDESWKVTTPQTTGLELRDARLTPVKGRMAWFHLREFQLGIGLARHEAVLDTTVTAYALPRARTVEIEGQVSVEVTRAPLRSIAVKVPTSVAALVRWDSPLIGQRTLDDATGVWTLTFRKELLGTTNLRWHLSLPGEETAKAPAPAPVPDAAPAPETRPPDSTLSATLPRFELPRARRFTGAWVIEANTDTELSFATKGLQPLDALRPPRVEGYDPRHRVLATYSYGTAQSELRVTATRHESTRLTSAIVELLELTTVLARDGTGRHQAVMRVRHSGDQFFAVRLPEGAALLSTSVEHRLTKPVTAGPGEVRVPLPRQQGGNQMVRVTVVYQTGGDAWGGGGSAALQPLFFDAAVPVLSTSWRVHAPEGYSYVEPQTTLDSRYGESFASLPAALPALWRNLAARLPEPASPFARFAYANEARRASPVLQQQEMMEITPNYPKPMFVGTPVPLYTDRPAPSAGDAEITGRMQKIIIPWLQFDGASVENALETLRAKSREHDPEKRGLTIVVPPGAPPSTAQITLDLKQVPFDEALKYITDLSGMRYRIQGGKVVLTPLSDVTSEQYTRRFRVPSNFLEAITGSGRQVSAQAALEANGIAFPEGASAAFLPATGELIVRNTQPALDQVNAVVEELTPMDRVETPVEYKYKDGEQARREGEDGYYLEKMRHIIFPQVQFSGASLEEAIEFLRIKSRDFDSVERDPTKRGINLIIKPTVAPSTAQITLDLKDVPMSEALKYIADLSGYKVRAEPYAVVVVPVSDLSSDLLTRTFKVPPDFLSYVPPARNVPATANRVSSGSGAVAVLSANGFGFPEGATASFVPSTNQLIVRNTEAALAQLDPLIRELWRDYEERNPKKVDSAKSGLLPVKLELPAAGRIFEFHGNQKPEALTLRYQSWERQMAKACFWLLVGLFLFWCCGLRGTCWRTLLVALVLICLPIALLPSWLTVCNALLAGWFLGLIVWLLWRAGQWVEQQTEKEVAA